MIRFADLFCGIGGFRLGIENVSKRLNVPVKCVFSSEIDKNPRFVYEKNFKETPHGDITQISASDIPDIDILCGGFPCQDVSIAGKRAGLKGKRTGLFFDVIRIIQEKQPRIVFLENVKGLLNSNGGWDFARVLIELEDSGYSMEWDLLNSKDFGVAQTRERVFIIGHLTTSRRCGSKIFPIIRTDDEIHDEPKKREFGTEKYTVYPFLTPERVVTRQNGRRMKNPDEPMFTLTAQDRHGILIQEYHSPHQQDRIIDPRGISSCLPTGTGGQLVPKIRQNDIIRMLTPIECERLQGYPDNWTEGLSDRKRTHCLGNAVTVNVIEAIANKLLPTLGVEA